MTPDQFRAALAKLGFAQSERPNDIGLSAFARWLPCEARQARRMAAGDSDIPPGVAKLLRLMVARKIKPEDVR